jgi:RNA polymerase sigma factor (sigma-70 family)
MQISTVLGSHPTRAKLARMDVAPPISTLFIGQSSPEAHVPSDETLMLDYQAGDASAFDVLYARHRLSLFRFITRQIIDRGVAEEVFQEVWMNVIQSRERYEVAARFRTWLYTLAHHRMMDYFRQHQRAQVVAFTLNDAQSNETLSLDQVSASRTDEPEVRAESRAQGHAILRLLETLPAPQRETFLLSEEAGLTVAEIAVATGVTVEAAKSRLRYALQKLRDGLDAYR